MVVLVAAASAVLAVNAFPMIGNDSVVYLEHSMDLLGEGWVIGGFRMVGYPLYLAAVRLVAAPFGLDPLRMAVLVQRLLLITTGVLAWLWWRWWSVPFVLFLLIAQTIAFSNLLLIEGLALGVAALMVFPAAHIFDVLRTGDVDSSRSVKWLTVLVALLAFGLFLMRFTFVVFAAVPAVLVVAGWKTSLRRYLLSVFAGLLVCLSAVTLLMAAETKNEHGVFVPALGSGETAFYYAWKQVFSVRPDNQYNFDLDRFYNDGSFRQFIRDIGSSGLSYPEQVEAFQELIDEMFRAAGMSKRRTQLESAMWAMAGGRVNDLGEIPEQVALVTRQNVDDWIYLNQYAFDNGHAAFDERYNDGQLVAALITDPIGWHLPLPRVGVVLAILVPLSVLAMVWKTLRRPHSYMAMAALLVVVGHSIGLGLIYADNLRFVMPVSAFALAAATAVMARRRHQTTPAA